MTQRKIYGPGDLFPASRMPAINSAMCPDCEADVTEVFMAVAVDVESRLRAGEPFPVVGSTACPSCGRKLFVRAREPNQLSEEEKTQFKRDFPHAPETQEL